MSTRRQEIDIDLSSLKRALTDHLYTPKAIKIFLLVAGTYAGAYFFGQLFVVCVIFFLIFTNLSNDESGHRSAYSVFNENSERLMGEMDADQIDREFRHGGAAAMAQAVGQAMRLRQGNDDNASDADTGPGTDDDIGRGRQRPINPPGRGRLNAAGNVGTSRTANKPCPCGSGVKAKKCGCGRFQ